MSGITDAELQGWIDGLQSADPPRRDKAIRDLIGHAYERLRALAKRMLRVDFPRLAPHHETGSVVDLAALRLLKALGQCRPSTVAEFFGLAAQQTRWVLLDLARAAPRPEPMTREPADARGDPARIAEWTDFHRRVEQLPDEERQVVDLHFYKGLTQAQTARLLGLHEKEVSRLWLRAARKLPAWAPGD